MFVKKSTYEQKVDALKYELKFARSKVKQLEKENNDLKYRLDSLSVAPENIGGSVTVEISKDIETVKPIVRYNPETFEKLVELQYLNDTQHGNTFAMQLAYMTISLEALEQIVSSFEAPVEKSE